MPKGDPQTTPPPAGYAKLREAADYARVSVRTLQRAIAAGRLKPHWIGARLVIPYDEMDRFIRSGSRKAPNRAVEPPPASGPAE